MRRIKQFFMNLFGNNKESKNARTGGFPCLLLVFGEPKHTPKALRK